MQSNSVKAITHYEELIECVPDRPGHDFRYASDTAKMGKELGWNPSVGFEDGLETTVRWYLANFDWWKPLFSPKLKRKNCGRRN